MDRPDSTPICLLALPAFSMSYVNFFSEPGVHPVNHGLFVQITALDAMQHFGLLHVHYRRPANSSEARAGIRSHHQYVRLVGSVVPPKGEGTMRTLTKSMMAGALVPSQRWQLRFSQGRCIA